MSDEQLIKEIISGSHAAFETLMDKYQLQVFRTVMGFVHIKEDAEEVTQDIFIKVYQSLPSFNYDSEFSTWLYRITVNMSLNSLRKNKNRMLNPWAIFFTTGENPTGRTEQAERDKRIRMAIDTPERMAFITAITRNCQRLQVMTFREQ